MATTTNTKPFRFLDLPKELRLMVYELLPIRTTHHKIFTDNRPQTGRPPTCMTLIIKTVPSQILRTCRTIKDEAKAIIEPRLATVRSSVPRIIIESGAVTTLLAGDGGITNTLRNWFDYLNALTDDEYPDFEEWAEHAFEEATSPELAKFVHQSGVMLRQQAIYVDRHGAWWRCGESGLSVVTLAVRVTLSPWHVTAPGHIASISAMGQVELRQATAQYGGIIDYHGSDITSRKIYIPFEKPHIRLNGHNMPRGPAGSTYWTESVLEDGWEEGESLE